MLSAEPPGLPAQEGRTGHVRNQLPSPLAGTFDAVVVDNNGAPASVLEASKDFDIKARWDITPAVAALIDGVWELSAYVESIGPGPEMQVGKTIFKKITGTTHYDDVITVPAGTLPDNPDPVPEPAKVSGIYKIAVLLTHRHFGKVTNVSAIVDGPVVRIG